jgi:hypothetical protein
MTSPQPEARTERMTSAGKVEVTLKPCPFCKGEAELRSWDWPYVRFQVRCSVCKCQARTRMASEVEAIAAWNTRATEADNLALLREAVAGENHPLGPIWAAAWHAWEKDGHWAACEALRATLTATIGRVSMS